MMFAGSGLALSYFGDLRQWFEVGATLSVRRRWQVPRDLRCAGRVLLFTHGMSPEDIQALDYARDERDQPPSSITMGSRMRP